MNLLLKIMKSYSSIKYFSAICVLICIIHSSLYAVDIKENQAKQKIKEFVKELFIDIKNGDIKSIIDKYHKDGILSWEFGNRSKLEIETALKNSDSPLARFMFKEPTIDYYRNNCINNQNKIYTTPKGFYELYDNDYDIEIAFRGINNRGLSEYRVEISGKSTNINGIQCSLKLPSLYVVIENERVYLISIIYIIEKGLPGVD